MAMKNNDALGFVRTTIYLPRSLHESAKIMAVLARTNMSYIIREALADKIKKIKEQAPRETHEKT